MCTKYINEDGQMYLTCDNDRNNNYNPIRLMILDYDQYYLDRINFCPNCGNALSEQVASPKTNRYVNLDELRSVLLPDFVSGGTWGFGQISEILDSLNVIYLPKEMGLKNVVE